MRNLFLNHCNHILIRHHKQIEMLSITNDDVFAWAKAHGYNDDAIRGDAIRANVGAGFSLREGAATERSLKAAATLRADTG